MTNFENRGLDKAETGIYGLDELTFGGLARGRTTLLCGGPGTGKTVLAAQFLVNGAMEFDEPGVFLAFEEREDSIAANMAGFGWELPGLEAQGKLIIDHISVPQDLQGTGDWDLDGLLLRIKDAVESTGARRLVLDTIEVLFSALPDRHVLRRSLRSLFETLGEMGLATIVTAERGDGSLTRFGLEEYVSDCVILLDQRVTEQLATRRLRILKYRGFGPRPRRVPVPDRRGSFRFSPGPSSDSNTTHRWRASRAGSPSSTRCSPAATSSAPP